ncbi:hypothetical protein C8J56DRAFT_1110774 [Mycena floridula]|nr:hypothetical protein C8J56DRAFT_1110774 [Mycena floridula]
MARTKQASKALTIQQQKLKVQVSSKGTEESRKEKSSPRHESAHPTTPCQCHHILHHLRHFAPKSMVGEAASKECAVNWRSCGRGGELSVGLKWTISLSAQPFSACNSTAHSEYHQCLKKLDTVLVQLRREAPEENRDDGRSQGGLIWIFNDSSIVGM